MAHDRVGHTFTAAMARRRGGARTVINAAEIKRDLIVIGASAGGVEALIQIIPELPADLPATVAICIHRSPLFEGRLPFVFGKRALVRVIEPADGEPLERGVVYVAPRDHHLVIEGDRFHLDHGPKQHHTRPAADPLFHSAAATHGARVVGVILSGNGVDGVSGLMAIKQRGGVSLVQDPEEAAFSWMPRSALFYDDVDAVLPLARMPEVFCRLAAGAPVEP